MIWESLYFIGLLAMSAAIGRDSKAHCLNDLMGRIRDLQAHSFSQRSLWQKLNDSSSDQHLSVRAKGDSVWLSGIISLAIKQGRSVHEFLFQFERRLLEVCKLQRQNLAIWKIFVARLLLVNSIGIGIRIIWLEERPFQVELWSAIFFLGLLVLQGAVLIWVKSFLSNHWFFDGKLSCLGKQWSHGSILDRGDGPDTLATIWLDSLHQEWMVGRNLREQRVTMLQSFLQKKTLETEQNQEKLKHYLPIAEVLGFAAPLSMVMLPLLLKLG